MHFFDELKINVIGHMIKCQHLSIEMKLYYIQRPQRPFSLKKEMSAQMQAMSHIV